MRVGRNNEEYAILIRIYYPEFQDYDVFIIIIAVVSVY
jgi:hypothetical protein